MPFLTEYEIYAILRLDFTLVDKDVAAYEKKHADERKAKAKN